MPEKSDLSRSATLDDLHRAADIVDTFGDDESQLDRHDLPWAALQEFVDTTDWKDIGPEGPDRNLDPLALAIGVSIGWIAARNHYAPYADEANALRERLGLGEES